MKKTLIIFYIAVFLLAQTAAIVHIYEPEHLYGKINGTCLECLFLKQCVGTDLPSVPVLPFLDLHNIFAREKPARIVSLQWAHQYFGRAPPSV